MIPAVIAIIASIPGVGYLIAASVAMLLVIIATILFKIAAYTFFHIILFVAGAYVLLKVILPNILSKERRLDNRQMSILALFSVILIALGVPNFIFSVANSNNVALYQVALPQEGYANMASDVSGIPDNVIVGSLLLVVIYAVITLTDYDKYLEA